MEGMQAPGLHLQEALRLGQPMDIYYYTRDTTYKQSIPTVVDNRFKQALTSKGVGSNTFIIGVDQGISDVLFWAQLPPQGGGVDYTNLALPQGWLYSLIDRVSVRYAGSSQYFWTGPQMLIENLREMPNPETRNQLFQLGGAPMTQLSDFAGDNLYGYCYLNLPHCSPNGSLAKPNPLPSELLSQPVVITLELKPLSAIFSSVVAGGSLANAPVELLDAQFQVKQVHAYDRGELMIAPADKSRAYSLPLKSFYQNEVTINTIQPGQNQVLLTGMRSGQIRSIIMWLTDNDDTAPVTSAAFARNYFNFKSMKDCQLLYNGTVYYDAPAGSSEFWNLVSTETPSVVSNTVVSASGGTLSKVTTTSKWLEIPFSQVFEQLSGSHMYVAGKQILNSIINFTFTAPAKAISGSTTGYTLHVVYSYNSVLMLSGGSADYAF